MIATHLAIDVTIAMTCGQAITHLRGKVDACRTFTVLTSIAMFWLGISILHALYGEWRSLLAIPAFLCCVQQMAVAITTLGKPRHAWSD